MPSLLDMTSPEPAASAESAAELVAARARAYDEHYRTQWHARRFTRAVIEESLADFLQLEEGGHPNGNEIQCALAAIGVPNLQGRTIIDYCCGTGVTAIYFAMLGARVLAFDRSPVALAIARESARLSGVLDRIQFVVADARRLPCVSAGFDAVFCQSALHILVDYPECPPELARALKPGGKAVFCEEALRYNPILEAIRFLRRGKYRQCGGRAIDYRDLAGFGASFAETRIHHFNLLFQIKTVFGHPIQGRRRRRFLGWLDAADRKILPRFPSLNRLCGKVVVEYIR
jgi:SAM-dependent methyltransferase